MLLIKKWMLLRICAVLNVVIGQHTKNAEGIMDALAYDLKALLQSLDPQQVVRLLMHCF